MTYPVKYIETSFNLPHNWQLGVSHHAISYQGTEEVLIAWELESMMYITES